MAERWRKRLVLLLVALAVCAVLALRDAGASAMATRLDPNLILNQFSEALAWTGAYYAMWAALTPFIFFLARKVRIRRDRWLLPLAFHLPVGVALSALAPVGLGILFGSIVLGRGWPAPHDLLTPFWTRLVAVRALTDTSFYWMILASGHLLLLYHDYEAKRLQAAELERSLVTAQVEALKMKLQPHFLFNTLNSIGFLALERDTDAMVTMIERLGRLLRASVQGSERQLVPLGEELELLDEYLAIEEVRFKDRLRVVRRIDPAVAHALVPSLILQPIVENSIKHGFSRRLDASRLDLAIDRDADALVIQVSDDGPGLPPEWDMTLHCGRGLRNVIDRLEALYCGRWSFALRNGRPRGTVAELRIPLSMPRV
jgi:two-component sensor histidine kinase